MQVETELRDMFSYSLIPIVLIILLLIVIILILIFSKKKISKKKDIPVVVNVKPVKNLVAIKNHYLKKINQLLIDVNDGKIQSRKAYQMLSKIIRNYIYEATNIKVQNYTLSEIAKINMPVLYELVSEYYDPEFSKLETGNIINSIRKTRAVIERWK